MTIGMVSLATVMLLLQGCDLSRTDAVDVEPNGTLGGTVRTAGEVATLQRSAAGGDIDAMLTLATHYFGSDETERGQYWLRSAARLGDCRAIRLLQDPVFNAGMPSSEVGHWNIESNRRGCQS